MTMMDMKTSPEQHGPRRWSRPAAVAVTSIAIALSAAACGSEASDASGSSRTITVGVPPNATGKYIDFAAENGYFDKHDLTVKTVSINGGAGAVPALESNSIQIGQSNVLSVIQGAKHGLETPCFAGAISVDDADGSDPLPLVSSPKSDISKPIDLAHKTIAVNATGGWFELAINSYLDSNGVDPSDVKYISMPMQNMAAAVKSGQVDAAGTAEPFASEMVAAGGTILTKNVYGTVPGQPEFACWNATSKWLKNNRDVATDFVAAWAEAAAAINADPNVFKAYIKDHGVPTEVADKFGGFVLTAKFGDEDVAKWIKAATKYGLFTGKIAPELAYFPLKG